MQVISPIEIQLKYSYLFIRPGYRLVDGKTCVEKENPYLMVVKSSQIVDLSLMPEDESTGHLTPIVNLKFGRSVDYDTRYLLEIIKGLFKCVWGHFMCWGGGSSIHNSRGERKTNLHSPFFSRFKNIQNM